MSIRSCIRSCTSCTCSLRRGSPTRISLSTRTGLLLMFLVLPARTLNPDPERALPILRLHLAFLQVRLRATSTRSTLHVHDIHSRTQALFFIAALSRHRLREIPGLAAPARARSRHSRQGGGGFLAEPWVQRNRVQPDFAVPFAMLAQGEEAKENKEKRHWKLYRC